MERPLLGSRLSLQSEKLAPSRAGKAYKIAEPKLVGKCLVGSIAQTRRDPAQPSAQRLPVEMGRNAADSADVRSFYLLITQCRIKPAVACVPAAMIAFLQPLRFDLCGYNDLRRVKPFAVGMPKSEQHFMRSEEHTSELQSRLHLVCRLLLEKKKKTRTRNHDEPACFTWYCRSSGSILYC